MSNALVTQLSRETLLSDDTVGDARVTHLSRETLLSDPTVGDVRVTHLSRETLLGMDQTVSPDPVVISIAIPEPVAESVLPPGYTVTVGGSTEHPLLDGSSISWDLNNNQARAHLVWNADSSFAIDHQDLVVITKGLPIFTGRVRNFSKRKSGHYPGTWEISADILDHVSMMTDTELVKAYNGESDQDIIIDIITTAGLSGSITATTADIDEIESSLTVGLNGSVRDALDQIASLTGGVWYLTADGTLVYNLPEDAGQAPFHFVDHPATNAWTYSEELGNAVWTKTNGTASSNAGAAPNGTVTADKFVEASDTAQVHSFSRNLAGSPADNSEHTVSLFVDGAGRERIEVSLTNKVGDVYSVELDISTGALAGAGVTGTGKYTITASGTFWRIALTQAMGTGSATTPVFSLRLHNGTSFTYNGGGTAGVLVWGLQHEADKYEAGDYVYTQAAARTGYQLLAGFSVSSRFDEPVNSVTVSGGYDASGLRVSELRTDASSISTYGTMSRTVKVENILSSAMAILYGDAYLQLHANPEVTGTGSTRVYGIGINQLVRVTAADYGLLSQEFLVSHVTLKEEAFDKSLWSFTLGRNTIAAERLLRQFADPNRGGQLPSEMLGVEFDGVDQRITFASGDVPSTVDDLNVSGLTISLWFLKTADTADKTLIDKDGGWSVFYNNVTDTIGFQHEASTTAHRWHNDIDIQPGTVYHVVISWNGGTAEADCTILVNGAGTTTKGVGSGTLTSEGDTGLRLANDHGSEYFDGWIRDFMLWNAPMGVSDRTALLNDTSGAAASSIRIANQLVRLRLDDKADGEILGAGEVFDSWNSLSPGTGTNSPEQAIKTYIPY